MSKNIKKGKSRGSESPSVHLLSIEILQQIYKRRGFSNRILDHHLRRYPSLGRSERGLVTNFVYGVLRHRSRLDYLINHFSRKPNQASSKVRELLRICIFELLELKHPIHHVISNAASASKKLDTTGAVKAFVHAILAKVQRDAEAFEAVSKGSLIDELENRWSIPRWLGLRWIAHLGDEKTLLRAKALALPQPVDIRIDCSRISLQEVKDRLSQDIPDIILTEFKSASQALRVEHAGPLSQHPLHEMGFISIQGIAAQQAAIALAVKPGQRVLDACAGLGVKTLQLAELMERNGTIVAVEQNATRIAKHQELIQRGRLCMPQFKLQSIHGDMTQSNLDELDQDGPFDAILLDAPCTGLGNLARHPELRWFRVKEDISTCVALQERLLENCLLRLSANGRMVYSVCSLEPEEGPGLCQTFAMNHHLQLYEQKQMTPEDDHCDGFYLAVFERISHV